VTAMDAQSDLLLVGSAAGTAALWDLQVGPAAAREVDGVSATAGCKPAWRPRISCSLMACPARRPPPPPPRPCGRSAAARRACCSSTESRWWT